jgi:hypothetical protein
MICLGLKIIYTGWGHYVLDGIFIAGLEVTSEGNDRKWVDGQKIVLSTVVQVWSLMERFWHRKCGHVRVQ